MPSRRLKQSAGIVQSPFDTVGQQFQARPDIADDLALRKVDPLHVGGRVADMDHLRALRTHDEGRLFDGVVPDGNDQVGAIDGLMHIITLAECGRTHVQIAAARYGSLAHLRREEWNFCAADEPADPRRAARTGRGGAQHD